MANKFFFSLANSAMIPVKRRKGRKKPSRYQIPVLYLAFIAISYLINAIIQ